VKQVDYNLARALAVVQQARTHWQAQLRVILALLGLMVDQVVSEWPRAPTAVQQAHTHWQPQSRAPLA